MDINVGPAWNISTIDREIYGSLRVNCNNIGDPFLSSVVPSGQNLNFSKSLVYDQALTNGIPISLNSILHLVLISKY